MNEKEKLNNKTFKFELGVTVKDLIHGLEGVITGRCQYLTGCTQYLVQPPGLDKDGKVRESYWLDEGKLEQTRKKQVVLPAAPNGGPQRNSPARRY